MKLTNKGETIVRCMFCGDTRVEIEDLSLELYIHEGRIRRQSRLCFFCPDCGTRAEKEATPQILDVLLPYAGRGLETIEKKCQTVTRIKMACEVCHQDQAVLSCDLTVLIWRDYQGFVSSESHFAFTCEHCGDESIKPLREDYMIRDFIRWGCVPLYIGEQAFSYSSYAIAGLNLEEPVLSEDERQAFEDLTPQDLMAPDSGDES